MKTPYTREDALECARAAFGPRGWAFERRRFLGTEKPNAEGFVVGEGPITSYGLGYYRKGKRGRLSTEAGSSSTGWGDAIQDAMNGFSLRSGTAKRQRFITKVSEIQKRYQTEGKIK